MQYACVINIDTVLFMNQINISRIDDNMAQLLSNEVIVDMVNGEANENSMEAARIYHERFLNRHRMFTTGYISWFT